MTHPVTWQSDPRTNQACSATCLKNYHFTLFEFLLEVKMLFGIEDMKGRRRDQGGLTTVAS